MIEFRNVSKTLGGRRVLDGLSFHVKEGETFIIVGPSGTGKSVTLSHIIGLMQPDSGDVIVDGMHVERMHRRELEALRSGTGMLFQGGALLNWICLCANVTAIPRNRSGKKSWRCWLFWNWKTPCTKCRGRFPAAW